MRNSETLGAATNEALLGLPQELHGGPKSVQTCCGLMGMLLPCLQEELKLATVLFQNLFPAINVQTANLSSCQVRAPYQASRVPYPGHLSFLPLFVRINFPPNIHLPIHVQQA